MEEPGVLIMVSFTMQLLTTVVSTPVNWKFFYQYANETLLYMEVSLSREWKTRLFFQTMMAVIKGPMASM